MDNQPVTRSQLATRRIEHVQVVGFFGVEAMQRGRRAQAYGHFRGARQIQTSQPQVIVGFPTAVDPIPKLVQRTCFQLVFKSAPGNHGQYLTAGRDSGLFVKQPFQLCVHHAIV